MNDRNYLKVATNVATAVGDVQRAEYFVRRKITPMTIKESLQQQGQRATP